MKRIIAVIAILLIVLFGGCQMKKDVKPSEMSPNDLPDERAFQDEFTREFLQSAEETRPGYYPFLSKTEKYKMDFQGEGVILKKPYTIDNNAFEGIVVGVLRNGKVMDNYTFFYYGDHKYSQIENNLEMFQKRVGKSVDFELIEDNAKSIYYSNFQRNDFHNHIAYIINKLDSGAIELIYSIDCLDNKSCMPEAIQEEIVEWIKTIQFINENESVND